jgi:ABC-2 type transport system permease protein
MSSFTNIVKKELRELLTKSTVLPIVAMALLFSLMGNMFGGVDEAVTSKPTLGFVNQDGGALSEITTGILENDSTVIYNGTDVQEGLSVVQGGGGSALIVIPSNFTDDIMSGRQGTIEVYWIMQGAGMMDTIPSAALDSLYSTVSRSLSAYLIETNESLNASLVLSPATISQTTIFHDKEMAGVSPSDLSSVMSAQSLMVPLVIVMIVIMAGGMVVSSMGLEKENKTLETLLTLPVSRTSIISGKLVASAIVGLLMAAIYMVGFSYYMNSLSVSSNIDLKAYGLTLSAVDYALVGLSLFASLLAALALCMVIGTFASNYKSAQTLTMPITILALIPMFITMSKDFGTLPLSGQIVMFAIPFSHPMMSVRSLMFGDYNLVLAGIGYSALFAIVMIAIAVWIFKTDRLLTGRIGKKARNAKRMPNLLSLIMSKRRVK